VSLAAQLVDTVLDAVVDLEPGIARYDDPGVGAARYPAVWAWVEDYTSARIDFLQEEREFTVEGRVERAGEDESRETVQTLLDGLRDAIEADPTLGGLVETALFTDGGVTSLQEAGAVFVGSFTVVAEVLT